MKSNAAVYVLIAVQIYFVLSMSPCLHGFYCCILFLCDTLASILLKELLYPRLAKRIVDEEVLSFNIFQIYFRRSVFLEILNHHQILRSNCLEHG